MFSRLKLLLLTVFDFFFLVSGLLQLKTIEEALGSVLFMLLLGFVIWSTYKVLLFKRSNLPKNLLSLFSLFSFYFSYFGQAVKIISKEEHLGSTKNARLFRTSLSLLGGGMAFSVILYGFITKTHFTLDFFLRYGRVFLFVVFIPFLMILIRSLNSGSSLDQFMKNIFGLFAYKVTCLFIYFISFFTPVVWLFMIMMSYIGTKASLISNKNEVSTS